jgi:hypothetical protein
MNKKIKNILFVASSVLLSSTFTSCEEKLDVAKVNEDNYTLHNEIIGSLKSNTSPMMMETINLYNGDENPKAELLFHLSKAANHSVLAEISYNPDIVDDYNAENLTDFEPLPQEAFTLQNEGKILIAPGDKMEYANKVFIDKSRLTVGTKYMAPFKIAAISDGASVSSKNNEYSFVVINHGAKPSTDKGTGIRTILYFGNDTNPLLAQEFTLKNSGKQWFDIACLFAANINWDKERHCCFLKFNPWITRMLNDRETYLKPLQDKGIKVTLSILTGVSVLSETAARDMARQLKDVVDAYELDGLEFDDEYNSGFDQNSPGIEYGGQSYKRLVFECKKLMPDKIMGVYDYGSTGAFDSPIDGVGAGQYVDYALEAMYSSANYSVGFNGMSKSQIGPYSRHGGDGKFSVSKSTCDKIRNDGYGIQMFFGFPNWSKYQDQLQVMSNAYFDYEMVFSGTYRKKDW